MSITASELVIRYSANRTATSANGGRMSTVALTSGAKQNFFPDWTAAQMASGATRYRKFFVHNTNAENLALTDAMLHLLAPTPAGDRITMFGGTADDTQADIGSPTEYGAAALQSAVAAGATSLTVTLEDDAMAIFRTGDQIFVTDGTNSEYHDAVTVAQNGSLVAISLAPGDMLTYAYTSGAVVASVLPLGTIVAAIATVNKVTGSGGLDATAITADNQGSISQTVTLTMSSTTTFSAVSDVLGSLGTGSIGSDFAPVNSDYTRPYLTVPATAWSGTWAAGETATIPVTQAAPAVWLKNVVPAGAAAYGNDAFTLRVVGGSA